MTDERYPDDIQSIADALASLPPEALELRSLLERHPQLTPPDVQQVRAALLDAAAGTGGPGGALSLVSQQGVGQESQGSLGMTAVEFYGQANLLLDPLLELMTSSAQNILSTPTVVGEEWSADYDIVSGAGPSTSDWNQYHFRVGDRSNNPFNTAEVEFQVNIPASATVFDVYAYPTQDYGPGLIPLLPFLVAGVKVRRTNSGTPAAGTSLTITLQVWRDDDVVIAESPALDYASITDFDDVRTLWAAAADTAGNFTSSLYRWRLKLHYVGTGTAGSNIRIAIGEPLLQWWWTNNTPPPFGPMVAQWRPTDIARLRTGGTAFPVGAIANDQFYRTDLQMWFTLIGNQWRSTQQYVIDLNFDPNAPFPLTATLARALRHGVPPLSSGGTTLDIRMEDHVIRLFVNGGGTALDNFNKWVGTLNKYDASNAGTVIDTININSGSSGVWRRSDSPINALLENGTPYYELATTWTKTGTPGSLVVHEYITYRYVAT